MSWRPRTMGDAAGAMSAYSGPDVSTSVSQALSASGSAQGRANDAAYYADLASQATTIPSAQAGLDGANAAAADALNYAAVAIAAANNAGLAMNNTAVAVAANAQAAATPSPIQSINTGSFQGGGGGH